MPPKSANHHDINTSDELESSTLSRGQLIQWVADLQWQLSEQRTLADREREPAAIHCDTGERERETVTNKPPASHVNEGPLKSLRTNYWVECKWSPNGRSSQAHQHPLAPPDLRFKLNQRRSQITSPHGDPKSHNTGPPRKWMRGHYASTPKRTGNAPRH